MAEYYHGACENNDNDQTDQCVALYRPTGKMSVYPAFDEPYETSLTKAISDDSAYTPSNISLIRLTPIGSGRYMTFTAVKSNVDLRQLSIWFYHNSSVGLTLSIYDGEGVTTSVKIASSVESYALLFSCVFCLQYVGCVDWAIWAFDEY